MEYELSLDHMDTANYNLINNFLFLSMIVEGAVAEQLQVFLDDSSILDPFQIGFYLEWR